jgi:hypothetical protein
MQIKIFFEIYLYIFKYIYLNFIIIMEKINFLKIYGLKKYEKVK